MTLHRLVLVLIYVPVARLVQVRRSDEFGHKRDTLRPDVRTLPYGYTVLVSRANQMAGATHIPIWARGRAGEALVRVWGYCMGECWIDGATKELGI
eukprot:scaffold128836_cov41-Prasinocladus_malaysianus.AAC.1